MSEQTFGPDNPSGDYAAMANYWAMVDAILGGAETMRAASDKYLPKFENESREDYKHRRETAPFTNIYEDVSGNLASKPFSRELVLKDGASEDMKTLAEDIDGLGNNLHNFAAAMFQRGIDKAIDWIFVDHTRVDRPPDSRPLTVAEERSLGLRPYWVHVPAERMLAVYSDREDGQEIFVHARILEPVVEREEYAEVAKTRVRVLSRTQIDGRYGPATYEIFEKQKDKDGTEAWASIEGPEAISIGVIALVPFVCGKRKGTSWQLRPPLRRVAELQVDEFQQESNLKTVLEAAAYPMLTGNGIARPVGADGNEIRVPVGPRGVLFAPPDGNGKHGEWKFIEPSGDSIRALEARLDATQKNMRDLGMQPLTQANLTVITTANVSLKAHSAVQAWALRAKDALEQALRFTAMWRKDTSKAAEVEIFTDFGVDFEATTEVDSLLKGQAQGVLSKRTTQEEFRRRGVLSDNFDPEEEAKRLAADLKGTEPAEAVDPITGERVEPLNRPVIVKKPGEPATPPAAH